MLNKKVCSPTCWAMYLKICKNQTWHNLQVSGQKKEHYSSCYRVSVLFINIHYIVQKIRVNTCTDSIASFASYIHTILFARCKGLQSDNLVTFGCAPELNYCTNTERTSHASMSNKTLLLCLFRLFLSGKHEHKHTPDVPAALRWLVAQKNTKINVSKPPTWPFVYATFECHRCVMKSPKNTKTNGILF